ncbi:chemotaxis protein CheA [Paenibacillus gallinarum]|uniref:Chemotaxis protein CheA n=1 Tax=Paenibacillus gallinarum TaxID=2762232 RepID=A0ABR8SUQ7_9BACL|nr:chemotaxis protein CheA [Paenibacillus gallinarum]MBD7967239.1 chemotaxis protein CheA [Paenibacillus gallinarum]
MDMNQYLSMFIDESNDHLQSLNEKMLELEQSPEDLSIVQVIFRSAHTLKGMAATMGFEDLASLTHKMENVLDLVRNEKMKMKESIFDVLFQSLDALESMVQDIMAGGEGKLDVSHIVSSLLAIEKGEENSPSEVKAPHVSGTDTASSMPLLDEFQSSVLLQSIHDGAGVMFIQVSISRTSQLKSVRAYMVFDLLERSGDIIKTEPSVQQIEQDQFEYEFSLYYITQMQSEELKKAILNISEIEEVNVTPLTEEMLGLGSKEAAAATEVMEKSEATQETDTNSTMIENTEAVPGDAKEKTVRAASKTNTAAAASKTIRVDIERLDVLMNLFSELLIDRSRLEQLSNELEHTDLIETVAHMSRVSSDLQNIVLKLRMVPVDTVFNRFPRMIRDLAKSLNKKVDLVITGADTELDRTVIDEIGDPLVHLLRNAVDHGVESISTRVESGKSETGTIQLRAFHSGNHVFIEIEDDGAGIYRDKLLKIAISRGVVTEAESAEMTDQQVFQLLFAPGFSTAETISDISGRGVGLDVVKAKITSLGGNVTIHSVPGKGTNFSVQLPLTLSIISAMLIKLGSEKYAIPLSSIVETGIVKKEKIRMVHGTKMISFREALVPFVSLAEFFNVEDYSDEVEDEIEIVVIRKGDQLAALAIDDFIGQNEIVIKTLGKYLPNIQGISGATILGDGQVALIIDPNGLIK